MAAKTSEDILGTEYDWLALDREGHVGFFSTAGGGRAPDAFLEDTEPHDEGIDALLAAPASTSARFYREIAPGLANTWKQAAERGLFAFDSDPNGGPYRLIAAPATAATGANMPEPTLYAARRVVLADACFAELVEGAVLAIET